MSSPETYRSPQESFDAAHPRFQDAMLEASEQEYAEAIDLLRDSKDVTRRVMASVAEIAREKDEKKMRLVRGNINNYRQ